MKHNHRFRYIRRLRALVAVLCAGSSAQQGGIAPFMILTLAGALLTTAYVVDVTRMTSDKNQLKRATDAAALALGREFTRGNDDFEETQGALAEDYVRANLGMDAHLAKALDAVTVTKGASEDGNVTFRVDANFTSSTELTGFKSEDIAVHSTAEVQVSNTEVALVIPNTSSEGSANLAALRRIGKDFAERLIDGQNSAWLALVPYSEAVSVYDSEHTNRVREWSAPGALTPVELTSLFNTGYSGLADRRIPDRRSKLLCMYRGLNRGENYFWDQAPSGAFQVYYRADLPENMLYGGYFISWWGPNPSSGQATGAPDTRYMISDHGCPKAPLLPLTNDLDAIDERLDEMTPRWNANYAIAMGWAAMALAPNFRGMSGWDLDDDLPKDFDEGDGENLKAIILLANTTDQRWFDRDAYNRYVGEKMDGANDSGTTLITERFRKLCKSFRAHDLKFYLIATGTDETPNNDSGSSGNVTSASEFRKVAGEGLRACVDDETDLTYLSGEDFVASEAAITSRMTEIVQDLRNAGGFIRLIE